MAAGDAVLFRTLHKPRVAIRAEASTKAEIVHVLVASEIFKVSEELPSGWVKLAPEEAWVRAVETGYVLCDGREIGLGKLIEPVPNEEAKEELWPYAAAISIAAVLRVPFQMKGDGLRPQPREKLPRLWLSAWHTQAAEEVKRPLPMRGTAPRLSLAVLLRGTPATTVRSFVQYHLAIGFGLIFLFFDAPEEPKEREAIAAAQSVAASQGGIIVHLCTEEWWQSMLLSSRFAQRRHQSAFCEETMQLFESVRDVQSRQCLAVDAAAREAQKQGYDWLLHIDSDEALHLPKHADARSFFAELQPDVNQVVFNNLEAVPESFDIEDWFRDVSLFKVHQNLLCDTTETSSSKKYLEKLERWRQRQLAKGMDREDVRTNRSFDSALLPVRIARRRTVQELRIVLPPQEEGDEEPFDSDEEPSQAARKAEFEDLPCYFVAYGNGKAACRLTSPPPLPVGVHRFGSDRNERLHSHRCGGRGAPVVLHYANCGYSAWQQKYAILARGHGTEDGGFSIERKGIKSMRAHLAHRALCQRGQEEDLRKYYRTYIMGNEFGELPHFANAARQMMVQCPPNASAGETLQVTSPDGFDFQVTVPLGVAPGQQFAVAY
ncbi:ELD1 [Symbiodinium natans]|uniref:ELD1 protein n=1 Tax=Symbiodinium natans TaxID=878477 RepID=A0A812M9E2_9DINO|nr:ELD1 [Symbiodinium natans]